MNISKSVLALAIAAGATLGVNQEAAANVYAGSGLDIQGLTVVVGGATPATQITSFQFTATNTATLNGASSPVVSSSCGGTPGAPGAGTNDCGAFGTRIDPNAANAPGGTVSRANNDFSLFGPGLNQYSNADSLISQAELTLDGTTATKQIAESEIQSSGSANSNAEITSNTGFILNFIVDGTGTLSVSFQADPYLRALINTIPASSFLNGNAQANINSTFSLTNAVGDQITWSPQGTATNDCSVDAGLVGAACVETADGQDLNRNLSTSVNPNDISYSLATGFSNFGINITGLTGGRYTLAFNAVTSNSVRVTVPEPGMIALLGMGLMGMGFASRRSAQSTLRA